MSLVCHVFVIEEPSLRKEPRGWRSSKLISSICSGQTCRTEYLLVPAIADGEKQRQRVAWIEPAQAGAGMVDDISLQQDRAIRPPEDSHTHIELRGEIYLRRRPRRRLRKRRVSRRDGPAGEEYAPRRGDKRNHPAVFLGEIPLHVQRLETSAIGGPNGGGHGVDRENVDRNFQFPAGPAVRER